MMQGKKRGVRGRAASGLILLMVIFAAMVGAPSVVQGADPELNILTNQVIRAEPGPGWPEGWTPPAAPTELTPDAIHSWERLQALPMKNKPERLEMRVLDRLPEWTKEYPYVWSHTAIRCSAVMYEFYYPYPDSRLLLQLTGDTYTVNVGPFGGDGCQAGPVNFIARNHDRSMEEIEAERAMWARLYADAAWSMDAFVGDGGLEQCRFFVEGTNQDVPVCFNQGDASARFDVPAYLDPEVGRVRVPVRFVSEMMGATVSWNQDSRQVTIDFRAITREVMQPITKPGFQPIDWWFPNDYTLNKDCFTLEVRTVSQPQRRIVLTVGDDVALVDGGEVKIDAPPVIKQDRVMIPIRFVAQAMDAKVFWVGDKPIWNSGGELRGTRQVHIYTRFSPFFVSPTWFLQTRGMGY